MNYTTMAYSTRHRAFHLFPCLPAELRLQIWQETLPDLDGVTLHGYKKGCWDLRDPLPEEFNDEESDALTRADKILDFRHEMLDDVHIDMPIVFVNREARSTALSWARAQGIKMDFNTDKACHVFVLPFNPWQDALFINSHKLEEFCVEPADRLAGLQLRGQSAYSNPDITQVALPHTALTSEMSVFYDLIHWFPRLEVVYIIVDIEIGADMPKHFSAEERRRAKERMKHQRWKTSQTQGHSYAWDSKDRKFVRSIGTPIGFRSMYREIEDYLTVGIAKVFAKRDVERFEIRPVLMIL
ncbi:uncharacterized protein TrAtP1_001944 [Trichoderma atroviride]|nr:hypothetical protein TrAtP1_001944 [Trichoderma atroviride]